MRGLEGYWTLKAGRECRINPNPLLVKGSGEREKPLWEGELTKQAGVLFSAHRNLWIPGLF